MSSYHKLIMAAFVSECLFQQMCDATLSLKVALFLMDTQGLFDLMASAEKITVIGTLSFLMSSLQCFNVKEVIHCTHLEYIYVSFIYQRRENLCYQFQYIETRWNKH